MTYGTKYGTRGTLRKKAEDYKCKDLEALDREMETLGRWMMAAIVALLCVGVVLWGVLR